MSKFPAINAWLEVWSRELAVLQWSNTEGENKAHAIFAVTAALQVKPLISVYEEFDAYMNLVLERKDGSSDIITELMEITLRIIVSVDHQKLAEEVEVLFESIDPNLKELGLDGHKGMSPLKTYAILHRIYAVEISARIKAYEPQMHNPILGMYRPMVEEMLLGLTKETKGA